MIGLGAAGLLYEGQRIQIPEDGLVLGRAPDEGLPVDSERASRRHARVEPYDGGYRVVDLGSKNGTHVNGEPIRGPHPLSSGDIITLGGETLRFVWGEATREVESHLPVIGTQLLPLGAPRITLGRDRANDLVLDDPNVSRFHAEVRVEGDAVEIADLGSANGTYLDAAADHARPARPRQRRARRPVPPGPRRGRPGRQRRARQPAPGGAGRRQAHRGQADPAADVAHARVRAASPR